jgi:hypothetical protein
MLLAILPSSTFTSRAFTNSLFAVCIGVCAGFTELIISLVLFTDLHFSTGMVQRNRFSLQSTIKNLWRGFRDLHLPPIRFVTFALSTVVTVMLVTISTLAWFAIVASANFFTALTIAISSAFLGHILVCVAFSE